MAANIKNKMILKVNEGFETSMNDTERKLKNTLMKMLINKDGKYGPYHHSKYAAILNNYFINIIPIETDPSVSAKILPDNGIICIGEGFLNMGSEYFFQLTVIIRHEIAHKLLEHSLKMMKRLGKENYAALCIGSSFHNLINIIADFEISNRKYTTEDKEIIRNMKLSGKIVGGLITEDHRAAWAKGGKENFSLEEMYTAASIELKELKTKILAARDDPKKLNALYGSIATERDPFTGKLTAWHPLGDNAISLYQYLDTTTPSVIWVPADEFFEKSTYFLSANPIFQKAFFNTYNLLKDNKEKAQELFDKISTSDITEPVFLSDGTRLQSPELKWCAMQSLKYILGNPGERPKAKIKTKKITHSKEYIKAYNDLIRKIGRIDACPTADVEKIARGVFGSDLDIDGELVDYKKALDDFRA